MVDGKVNLVSRVPQIMDHHVEVDPRVLNLQLQLVKLFFVVVNSYFGFLLLPTLSRKYNVVALRLFLLRVTNGVIVWEEL